MTKFFLLSLLALATGGAAHAQASTDRIQCDGVTLTLNSADRSLVADKGERSKFFVSKVLEAVLLTRDESFDSKRNALKKADLLDAKDKSIAISISGGWTGMRVSYDLAVRRGGIEQVRWEGCSYAPYGTGRTD